MPNPAPHAEGKVLAVLASANGGMVTDRLISAAVWPDRKDHKASINAYIHRLRKRGHQIVRYEMSGYQLIEAR